jgi:hypothetical protein
VIQIHICCAVAAGLRMQRPPTRSLRHEGGYARYSGGISMPDAPTEAELAARTTTPNVISWLDR